MKKIFRYLGILMSAALMGVVTSCDPELTGGSTELGLGIKVFFPTKVVAGQPMTINGSGFSAATEIVFPGATVSNFEIVSNDMIRVNAPAGISAEGGKIIVRTADAEAESRLPLTVGNTRVSGYSKMEGETVQGGELFTIYGQDLEFINSMQILDADGNPFTIKHENFYRKGTSTVVVKIPQNVFEGPYAGLITTIDGKTINMPEFNFEPAPTGHWESVRTILWKNDDPEGNGVPSWGGQYRFSNVETATGEEIYAFPMEDWAIIKDGVFRLAIEPRGEANVRVTTGWWSGGYVDTEYNCAELMQEDADGTLFIEFNMKEDGNLYDNLDQQHLLLTGSDYIPLYIYTQEDVWVENGSGPVEVTFWENDGSKGAINWGSEYRFGLEGNDALGECMATFPQEVWDVIKGGSFFMVAQGSDWVQMRITTGWWGSTWTGNDIMTGDERIIDNGDGTFTIEFNFSGDPILDLLDQQHLLLTGGGYTPLRFYYLE